MRTSEIIEGMSILLKYYDNPNGYHTGVENDVLFMYTTDRPVSEPDILRLIELGWLQDEVVFRGDDGEILVEHYDPKESWICHI